MFMAALSIITPTPISRRMDKEILDIHTVGYYTVTRTNKLQLHTTYECHAYNVI